MDTFSKISISGYESGERTKHYVSRILPQAVNASIVLCRFFVNDYINILTAG
jgi:hypothetical protein